MRRHVAVRAASCVTVSTRRTLASSFYDSQSGRTVTVPTGPQCHLGLKNVPTDRISSALAHLLQDGQPVKGLASVSTAVASDEQSVEAAASKGHSEICIEMRGRADAVAAVQAALRQNLVARVVLPKSACTDAHEVQLTAAELGDAGASAILLSLGASADADDLRSLCEMACEIDLLDVPMIHRLGLCVEPKPAPSAAKLVRYAHEELGMLHFYSCLAGVSAPRPTDVLKACGLKAPDMAMTKLMLAEHVPDAA